MKINAAFTLLVALCNTNLQLNLEGCSDLQRKEGNDSGKSAIFLIKI